MNDKMFENGNKTVIKKGKHIQMKQKEVLSRQKYDKT